MSRWSRSSRWALVLLVAASGEFAASSPARADDPAPAEPKAKAPTTEATAAVARAESKVMLTLMKATGRLMLKYLDEKQDPEKAAAYDDVFRALGGVLSHLDPGDERGMVAAGMKAMLDLLPTMKTPKRAEVMRVVMTTLAGAVAEGVQSEVEAAAGAPHPEVAAKPHALGDALVRGLADGLFQTFSERALRGAQLEVPAARCEGFRVKAVKPGSWAAELGLRAGDTIVQFGDTAATGRSLLDAARTLRRRGDLALTVLREGARVELKAPPKTPKAVEPAPPSVPK